jgi:hypothetical protein
VPLTCCILCTPTTIKLYTAAGSSVADAYKRGLEFFDARGVTLSFLRIDNKSSDHLRMLLARRTHGGQPIALEFVNVKDHRRNKAVCGIQTFERHCPSALATAAPDFSIDWCMDLLPLLEITLNHLVPWAKNPALSAWHGLHGRRYDFAAHPLPIAGCQVSRQVDRANRGSLGPKAGPAWALGPAPEHSRAYKIVVLEKGGQLGIQFKSKFEFHLPCPTRYVSPVSLRHPSSHWRCRTSRQSSSSSTLL